MDAETMAAEIAKAHAHLYAVECVLDALIDTLAAAQPDPQAFRQAVFARAEGEFTMAVQLTAASATSDDVHLSRVLTMIRRMRRS